MLTAFLFLFFMSVSYKNKDGFLLTALRAVGAQSYTIFLVHHVIITKTVGHFTGAAYSAKGIFCIFLICLAFIGTAVFLVNRMKKLFREQWDKALRHERRQTSLM